jgi:hypothetical protein
MYVDLEGISFGEIEGVGGQKAKGLNDKAME